MQTFHFDSALLPEGWADDVRVTVDADGRISSVVSSPEDSASGEVDVSLGTVVPGLSNLHSHAFQRAMAGLTEVRGRDRDTFWSWREVMYDFVDRLEPEDVEAIATMAQVEMLEGGFTAVGEFHYLHHGRDGTPYDDPAEMAARICVAATRTGIGLTLLPVLYRHGGFGGRPTDPGQRRFVADLELYGRIVDGCRTHTASHPAARVGIAPHSLRAVTVQEIADALALSDGGPIHIHVAEQTAEVEGCVAEHGVRPVAHLLDSLDVDDRWCLVHATHMDEDELQRAAATGAVAGLCPVTEANLGDGLFRIEDWLDAGGAFGVGSDSNVRIDAADELRTLEYGRRLVDRRRNVVADSGGNTGRRLFDGALEGGSRALGRATAGIAPGAPADFVEFEPGHPILASRAGDTMLSSWIFGGDGRVLREVWTSGRRVVSEGQALARPEAESAWRSALRRLEVRTR